MFFGQGKLLHDAHLEYSLMKYNIIVIYIYIYIYIYRYL